MNRRAVFAVLALALSLAITTTALASHARPKAATPTRISLVPAHKQCTSPTNTHNAPFALPSCSPVVEESLLLTMKAPDRAAPYNGGATGAAYFQLKVYCTDAAAPPCTTNPGDQLDDEFQLVFTGIVCKAGNGGGCTGAGALYNGSIGLSSTAIRITDHLNSPSFGGPTGTMVDIGGFFNATCVSGNCNITTSADTFFAGNVVQEQSRANWEFIGLSSSLGAFEVYDEGLDGNFAASADNKVFLRAGLFNP
jgi:hypothetical protein